MATDQSSKRWWRKLDEQKEKAICDRYQAGESLPKLAVAFNVSIPTIQRVLIQNGIPRRRPGRHPHIAEDVKDRIVAMHKSGMSARQAGLKESLSTCTACRILEERGVERRPPGPVPKLRPELEDELIRKYNESQMTPNELADAFGYRRGCVHAVLRRRGVEIRPEEYRRRHSVNDLFFREITTDAQAWLIGFLGADGCIHTKTSWGVCVARKDEEIIEKIRSLIEFTGPIYRREKPGNTQSKPQSGIYVTSRKMVDDLALAGVTRRKTFTLQPWDAPLYLAGSYFRGLVDGDGSWRRRPDGYECMLCGTMAVVEAFRDYVARMTGDTRPIKPHDRIWRVKVAQPGSLKLLAAMLYTQDNISLDRKKEVAMEILARPIDKSGHWGPLPR